MTVAVEKWHGTGNDFLLVAASECLTDRRAFARTHCDRETGVTHRAGESVGADGVLFLAPDPDCRPPRVVMSLIQPDGSTAPMCGNGARVAAAWAADRLGVGRIMIDAPAGTREARIDGRRVAVEMGRPSFAPADVPIDRADPLIDGYLAGRPVTAVNTGVPHAVSFVPSVEAVDLAAVAGPIRHHEVFPRGTNVTLASRRTDGFAQRTYERGVEAETRSCGTGAVAVAAAARRLGRADGDVSVSPPGGDLSVRFAGDGSATLEGPVERRFETELPRAGSVRP